MTLDFLKTKKFTAKTVSARRQRLNLKTNLNESIQRQVKAAKINELKKKVNIANKGSKYISPADMQKVISWI